MVEQRHRAIAEGIARQKQAEAKAAAERYSALAAESSKPDDAERYGAIAAAAASRKPADGRAAANGVMRTVRALYNYALDRDSSLPPCPVRLKKSWFRIERRERR